jgi:hypothetical protein
MTISRLFLLRTWQKTHAPNDRRNYNNASNKLRTAFNKLRNDNFTEYVSQLKSSDNSLWKQLKSRKKPTTTNPPIRKSSNPPSPWAQNDEEKPALFARHLSEIFSPNDNTPDPEVETKLANINKLQEKLTTFTITELN